VLAVLAGDRVGEVAAKFGVSRQSVRIWVSRYRHDGLAGLADRSHRPESCPLRVELGFPEGFTFHDLRHTGNNLASATGANIRELMRRMVTPRCAPRSYTNTAPSIGTTSSPRPWMTA
jgi:hypothetical protein